MTPLVQALASCGPVFDDKAAQRAHEVLAGRAEEWRDLLEAAWPALAPVFSASPYLTGLVRRSPQRLREALQTPPADRLGHVLAETRLAADLPMDAARKRLRQLKAELHLVTALADLGGVWDLDAVTGALTRFADAALQAALTLAVRAEAQRGALVSPHAPGLFCVAMGKHGAHELNYSSDIDFSVFYEPDLLPVAEGFEPQAVAVRITKGLAQTLQDRTEDGYVFRVDLRLRPDPSSTPPAMPVAAALEYYETVGQNWERAAYIKARPAAGDMAAGQAFLDELVPFIWRRHLDFAAIADIHSIKRQIHAYKVDERLTAKGANLKLGRGGIREIEFFVQTQQLILGGRHPELRSPRTLDALAALAQHGQVEPHVAAELAAAYADLRALEHRVQMVADEQTHKLPENDNERRRIAALWGRADLAGFDAAVSGVLCRVNQRYGELFKDEEALSSRFGSLVFTGVEDDPETLATLRRMGFSNPPNVAQTIRGWHHGRIAATRTERGRELFTRLAPRLLEAAAATGAPDAAFARFSDFFSGLSGGVQVQSLFLAQLPLFELIVQVMAFAPRLAGVLSRRAAALDALLDPAFFEPVGAAPQIEWPQGFEAAMDAARRLHREQAFRIGVQVISGVADAALAGPAYTALADRIIDGLAPAALAETARQGGAFGGQAAVVALGKCGSGEMTAASDLDLMVLYRADEPAGMSELKGWGAETFYARFTQRLIAALSAPTAEGTLYPVDMQLRPTGSKGPVAVSFAAFQDYYADEAETWELMALTRARVAWATSAAFAAEAQAAVEAALRRPRDPAAIAADVRDMRRLLEAERPPKGDWDLKLIPGGLVDIEFAAQHLQLTHAPAGGPLSPDTAQALAALEAAGHGDKTALGALRQGWTLQQNLSQVLKLALEADGDPMREPKAFQLLLAKAGGARSFAALKTKLGKTQGAVRAAYVKLV